MEAASKPAIFVFTTAYHPFIGGVEIAIQEVAERLRAQFRFFIITARLRRDLVVREERKEGIVIRIGIGSKFDKWLLPVLGVYAFRREIRSQRLGPSRTLLWGLDISGGSLAAAFLKRRFPRIPFVFSIQYGYGDERLRRGRLGMIQRAFRAMLGRADVVTAISSYLADLARQYGYRGSVAVVPNGVMLERFEFERRERREGSPPVIITVSRLVPKNGVDILIRALARVRQSLPGIRCHIIGDGPERGWLEWLAQSLGIADAVTFFGQVPFAEVPRHLAAADVFCRPSRSEGMGNAFVEALAGGRPIIGTPVGGIVDIIRDGQTGLLARVDDPADVAEKIKRLLTDRALAERIVSNGLAMVEERFSWDAIADAYRKTFDGALERRPNILIATPQFPPAIGGPGGYAATLGPLLAARGASVSILSYGQDSQTPTGIRDARFVSSRIPSGLKHLVYAFYAWRMLGWHDVAVVFDPAIVGWPAAIACQLRRRPMIMRLEGDFLWEWYLERSGEELTLGQFYESFPRERLSIKERLLWRAARWVCRQAERVVFSSQWRKAFFELGYPLRPEQAAFIPSPWPAPGAGYVRPERVLVFAGRFVRVKNIARLIRAFLAAAPPGWRLELIGQGPERKNLAFIIHNSESGDRIVIRPPLPRPALTERIASCHAFVLPSLSEVSPQIILDCIAAGTPFLLTRETGFYETLKNVGLFCDPLDEHDMALKLRILMDPRQHAAYRERLADFKPMSSWAEAAKKWLDLIRAVL